jgi:DNA (cytosine-5)-methyltransferase 1
MRFLSVCSGIDAASVAWPEWEAVGFSEIEKFPSAVLAHRYPNVPNLGDMTKYREWKIGAIDLLVGGTPCQSFSVAGLRKGLEDPRGNLMLVYCGILDCFKPRWFVWENVPGVLSSNGGRDFGAFLGAVAELGYGWAYRVLDAQWFGVAQRRRRVFVVGCLGDWASAAAVLFEPNSLRRNTAPSREAWEEVAGTFTARARSGGWGQDPNLAAGGYMRVVAGTLEASLGRSRGAGTPPAAIQPYTVAQCLTRGVGQRYDPETESLIPILFDTTQITSPQNGSNGDGFTEGGTAVMQPVAFAQNQRDEVRVMEVAGALAAKPGAKQQTYLHQAMQVRRLTPVECERLQGFPDGYTNIPWRGKPESPDGPRYKALGNSMAVPVMKWIGKRIQMVQK